MDPESPPQGFNALRSKFEKLAHETSPAPARTATPAPIQDLNGLLNPETHSPRQRTQSNLDVLGSPATQHLRAATANLDLAKKAPPPPPPPRASKARSPSPLPAPLLRPVPTPPPPADVSEPIILPTTSKALVMRKPPPVPAARKRSDEEGGPVLGGVSALRSKFAPPSPSLPNMPLARPTGPAPSRVASYSSAFTDLSTSPSTSVPHHGHRHSFSAVPLVPTQSPSPLIQLHSPLLNNSPEHEYTIVPPPLPSRKGLETPLQSNKTAQHARRASQDQSESSPNGSSSSTVDRNPFEQSPPPPAHPKRPTIVAPPRPPPRHSSILTPSSDESHNPIYSIDSPVAGALQPPPPLPARRSPPNLNEESTSKPSLPARRKDTMESSQLHPTPAPPLSDRRVVGSSHLPPPPTRTIALGDKLPPARRPPSGGSSEESGDEEEGGPKGRTVDLLPDGSRSSRRPPMMVSSPFAHFYAHVPAHTGLIAVSGYHVVVAHHHIKIYDISQSESPIHHAELKDMSLEWRVKEPRVTSLEFRHVSNEAHRGSILWLGTKDGHLWEMDVRTGVVIAFRPAAHSHAITSIFRHGRTMITADENGKILVFAPEHQGPEGDVRLSHTQPRVVRIAEKQGFIRMLGGLVWTSSGPGSGHGGQNNGTSASARGPIIRVYDVLSPTCTAHSILPLESVGAVTSGTILPSRPGDVYLGHEGGFVTIWNLKTQDSVPECIEVVKVSVSDVLCLEGVNDRLWAGGRKGMIVAYDVEHKPWVTTNSWMAHGGLPVQKLAVDPWSLEKCGQLCVFSVGRDEQAKFWDGLLGVDWIDTELMKREASFSTFRPINILIVSWNIDAAKPDLLTGAAENMTFLDNALRSVDSPDIIAFGFQEMIDLENRKMAAKTVLLGGKKKGADGTMSEKVSRSYKMWYDRLVLSVRLAAPPECPYTVVHAENLVGLFTCIFVKKVERVGLKDIAMTTIKRGMGGRYGNKGGIVARFVIDDSSLCFINCHLAAGQNHTRTRNGDVAAILDEKSVFPETDPSMEAVAYTGGGDGSMVLDHEFVFLNGDLNYRIDQRRETVVAAIRAGDIHSLLVHDQLLKEMKFNRGFRLRSFVEGPLTFHPTYKYDRQSNEYDSSEKRRIPAWCDRILYRSRQPSRVEQLHYQRYEANLSDHRPISAGYSVTIKSVRQTERAIAKAEINDLWLTHQQQLLFGAREFYLTQEMI